MNVNFFRFLKREIKVFNNDMLKLKISVITKFFIS